MKNTKETIIKLQEKKEELGLSIDDILYLMDKKANKPSKYTLLRLFELNPNEYSEEFPEVSDDVINLVAEVLLTDIKKASFYFYV